MATWTAEPRHDWPDGHYIGATCSICGVAGFSHPKRAPRLCWPHYQEGMKQAEEDRARKMADMTAEYGPYAPPSGFEISFATGVHTVDWVGEARKLMRDPTNPFAPR